MLYARWTVGRAAGVRAMVRGRSVSGRQRGVAAVVAVALVASVLVVLAVPAVPASAAITAPPPVAWLARGAAGSNVNDLAVDASGNTVACLLYTSPSPRD